MRGDGHDANTCKHCLAARRDEPKGQEAVENVEHHAGALVGADVGRIYPTDDRTPVRADGRVGRRATRMTVRDRAKYEVVQTGIFLFNVVGAVVLVLPIVIACWTWEFCVWVRKRLTA